jgi:hypothetical protein
VGSPEEQSHPKRAKKEEVTTTKCGYCMANSSLVDDDHAIALMLHNTFFWLANKHGFDWLTRLLWLNLVGCLFRCREESTMNVRFVSCAF